MVVSSGAGAQSSPRPQTDAVPENHGSFGQRACDFKGKEIEPKAGATIFDA
jgi:hypothetical protein